MVNVKCNCWVTCSEENKQPRSRVRSWFIENQSVPNDCKDLWRYEIANIKHGVYTNATWLWQSPLKSHHFYGSTYNVILVDILLHTCLWSMEETLDQTRLINNSWETVAQPSCLQPQAPTTSGMLNTYTSRHIQHTLYKHNDSDMQELIFHHNGGILLVKNCWHTLAASELAGCLPKCCMCGASERWKVSTVTLPQGLQFIRHRRLGNLRWHFEHL